MATGVELPGCESHDGAAGNENHSGDPRRPANSPQQSINPRHNTSVSLATMFRSKALSDETRPFTETLSTAPR